jgi:hypothetical protein
MHNVMAGNKHVIEREFPAAMLQRWRAFLGKETDGLAVGIDR